MGPVVGSGAEFQGSSEPELELEGFKQRLKRKTQEGKGYMIMEGQLGHRGDPESQKS